jgi:prepilin-type N-terminal cleavage/methylation domain-containing protein
MRVFYKKSGFTLVEVLIVIALIALIGATVPLTMNFKKQLDRSNDLKRKKDLSVVRSAMDEFYNDNNRYPIGREICFDNPGGTLYVDGLGQNLGCICHICGKKVIGSTTSQEKMFSYIKEIPCDPNSSGLNADERDYIYNYDCGPNATNPQWYRIYAKLIAEDDPGIVDSGCGLGCGPKYISPGGLSTPNTVYDQISNNYAVTSSNVTSEAGTISCDSYSNLYCNGPGSGCSMCGTLEHCESSSSCRANGTLYIDSCISKCKK